ncbi:MFS transporter [Nonomuraea thailandensis]
MSRHDMPGPAPKAGGWAVLVLLCLAQFMLIVDITVVQVALPSIGADLALGREALTWVVTAYTLCFGGLMVLGGRLADVLGARRTLLAGLGLFTAASLVCGLAGSGAALVAGRALQGVGAALLSPAALAVIVSTFHGERRARALGVWAAIGGTGAALGVLVGGLLTAGPAGPGCSSSTCRSGWRCWPPCPRWCRAPRGGASRWTCRAPWSSRWRRRC